MMLNCKSRFSLWILVVVTMATSATMALISGGVLDLSGVRDYLSEDNELFLDFVERLTDG